MRKNYEMTEEDLQEMLSVMKSAPAIMLQCGPAVTVQERANAAWKRLGERMQFDHMTVRPTGQGDRFFSAEPLPCNGAEIEPGVYSGCDQSAGDCPTCGH